jgi:hypothetical protein
VGSLESAVTAAVKAWGIGLYSLDEEHTETPAPEALQSFIKDQLQEYTLETALLERTPKTRIAFSDLDPDLLNRVLSEYS